MYNGVNKFFKILFGVLLLLLLWEHNVVYGNETYAESERRVFRPDTTITIKDQGAFNKLQTALEKALLRGKKNIVVQLSGVLLFNDNQIKLQNMNYSDASIRIIGKNCRLLPAGRDIDVSNRDLTLNYSYSYTSINGDDISFWSQFFTTDSLINVVNDGDKLCCIHIPASFSTIESISQLSYIQYTEWYYTRTCKIEYIKDNYIYFKVPELFRVGDYYNVNYDYYWTKKLPRFRIFDCKVSLNDKRYSLIHEGLAGTFISIVNSKFRQLAIENISFYGNKLWAYLFSISNTSFSDSFLITDCFFSGQHGGVIFLTNSNNAIVQHCDFYNQYSTVIFSDNNTVNTRVCDNYFRNCGLGMLNSFCVRCNGLDYLINGNKFENYGYSAIAVGTWYKTTNPRPSKGIVDYNIIYSTDDYIDNIDQYGLIDGGAIYLWTLNDDAIIRYNFINNISGAGYNRGIYCDDGAKNFTLQGNIVMNVLNCNCIDARYAGVLENIDNTKTSNVSKVMRYNIINGDVKFQGKPIPENGCIKDCNYVTNIEDKGSVRDYDNLEVKTDDITIKIRKVRKSKVVVDRKTKKLLKTCPVYNEIKQYITVF